MRTFVKVLLLLGALALNIAAWADEANKAMDNKQVQFIENRN